MGRVKVSFPNAEGETLNGLLETPSNSVSIARYALFAHCFTCGKDIAAASRISRALANRGIAVLRFDFTGLGNSDGDFANSNFTSNVQDLLAAAEALGRDYQAPSLLVGHSLGGAAVLAAAPQLASVEAVVTIGSPATASHVTHLFAGARDTLAEEGETQVQIGGRAFCIRQQFLDDLDQYADADHLRDLKRPLLVFHSPLDEIVSINEAAKIYQAALHPKSFISLDRADHLLTRREDAAYVAETLVAWASRYLAITDRPFERSSGTAPDVAPGEVLVTERDKQFLRGLYSANHQLDADEPISAGGGDMGPSPYDLLLMSLGACTSMTLRLYANHKQWPLEDVRISLRHDRVHADDCADCENTPRKIERIRRVVTLRGDLTEEQRRRLLEIADRCPVHRTLESDLHIETMLDGFDNKKTGL